MKYLFLSILVYSTTAFGSDWVNCEIIDNVQNRNVLGSLKSNISTYETKVKLNGESEEVISEGNKLCGFVPFGGVPLSKNPVGLVVKDDPFGLFHQYQFKFNKPADGAPYTYAFSFLYRSANGLNDGHFQCRAEGDFSFEKGPREPFRNYSLQNCKKGDVDLEDIVSNSKIELIDSSVSSSCSSGEFLPLFSEFSSKLKNLKENGGSEDEIESMETALEIVAEELEPSAKVYGGRALVKLVGNVKKVVVPSIVINGKRYPYADVVLNGDQLKFEFTELGICSFANEDFSVSDDAILNGINSMLE